MAVESLGSPLRSFGRIVAYGVFTLSLLPVQAVVIVLRLPLRRTLPCWYHRRCCRLLGIRVERRGRISRRHPTLFVVNHISYLDISVLGSLIQGSFVAKSEVASWPIFGWLAKLQRTIFVDRQANRAIENRDALAARLEAGDSLILFPEGTSGDGNRVLPFKTSLLAVAEIEAMGRPVTVQPVSLAYTRLDGIPLGRALRPFVAWYGDMELASHLWQAMGLGRLTVAVRFHPPVSLAEFGSRKTLGDHCWQAVSQGVADALAGRGPTSARRGETGQAAAEVTPVAARGEAAG